MDGNDIRVSQAIEHSRFFKHLLQFFALRVDLFEGYPALEECILRQIDDSGRPMAEDIQPLVLAEHSE